MKLDIERFKESILKEDPTFQYTINKIEELKKEGYLVLPIAYVKYARKYHLEAYELVSERLMFDKYKKL